MTVPVPSTLTYAYVADGVTTVFSYPVRFLEAGELYVLHEATDGSLTELGYNVDYTVTGAGNPSGGSITTLFVPAEGRILISRRTVAKQLVDLVDNARNPAEAVEQQLDRMVMVDQDHDARIGEIEDKTTAIDQAVIDASNSAAAAAASEDNATQSETDAQGAADRAEAAAAGVEYPVSYGLPQPLATNQRLQAQINIGSAEFDDVAGLLADAILGYSATTGRVVVVAGDTIEAGGFRYEVAASGASDHHVATAGGVKMYLLGDEIDPVALGAVGYIGTRADWDAVLLAQTYTDDYAVLQKALDILSARANGGVLRVNRWHHSSQPLVVPYGVSIQGPNKNICGISKDSALSKIVTYYDSAAAAQVTIYPGLLPTNANAVLILGTSYASGRWTGKITGVTIGGTYATPGDWESQKVEFGVLSVGSLSDFVIDDNKVDNCKYGLMLPTPFVGQITNNRVTSCLSGFGVGNATTLTMHGNYAILCRDYGYAFRNAKYMTFFANACDTLNDTARFPDRTRECTAYILDSLIGCSVFSNGNEGTLGNSWRLVALRYCNVLNNQTIRIGSDYVGTEDIAVWKIEAALVGCTVAGNNGYNENANGLTFGGANPAKHHNIFLKSGTTINSTTIHNNVVRSVFTGLDTEAGWGNNNVTESLVAKRGGVYTRAEPSVAVGNILQGTGSSSATSALEVRNGNGTLLLGVRDDGNIRAQTVYDSSSGVAANVNVSATGFLTRATSALKYKDIVGPLPNDMIAKVLAIEGFIYSAKGGDPDRHYVGLAADHFHEAGLPEFVDYGKNGEVEGLMYDRITAVLLEATRRLTRRVEKIEATFSDKE